MIKKISIRILRLFITLICILLVLLVSINFPVANFSKQTTSEDYSTWMYDTLNNNQPIIQVAMLGAHDAFTSQMSVFSPVDVESADSIQTGFTGALIKGFSYRQSKTQVSDVTTLLESGVRYFDIRLTFNENKNEWMTSHTYFASVFSEILSDINAFLEDHPGEFLILDIQHVNGVDYSDDATFLSIRNLFKDSGVLDYAYSELSKPLSQITVGDITSNKTQAGVIILSKFEEPDPQFFSYSQSIRSAWANTDSPEALFQFLSDEQDLIESGEALTGNQTSEIGIDSLNAFRVMQGVLTMQMSGDGIVKGLLDWSLLSRAKKINSSLIENPDFESWLSAMPIVMVDYADTNKDEFLDQIMQILITSNENWQ